MLQSLRNIWDIPDLRKRVLFTLGLLAVYRFGNHIPTPGINTTALVDFFEQNRGNWFGLVDMFSGGNLAKVTVFALGIMPYISASIILQLLTVVWPFLEKLSKEGELGKRKITQYTRYGTVLLSIVQSLAIAAYLERMTLSNNFKIVEHPGLGFKLLVMLTLTTGTAFIMWLGEQITERGIGNGMSLIIFAGIVVGLPKGVLDTFSMFQRGELGIFALIFLIAMMVVVVGAIVFVERGQRRITVQYAKRVVGRRMYGGQSTHLPLRVNTSGVIPVIFASSIIAFPQTIASFFQGNNPWMQSVADQLKWGMPLYNILYVTFIIFFCYFYTAIVFNPDDVAENMRKYGGSSPASGPGRRRPSIWTTSWGGSPSGRHLPGPRRHPARVPDHGVPRRPHSRDRSAARHVLHRQRPLVDHGRLAPQLLLWRHIAPDRGRGGHGHGGPGRGAAHHAPLRGLQRQGRQESPWPSVVRSAPPRTTRP
jgi:preprotein translocase subunit SecY